MPCDSSYMNPSQKEILASDVFYVRDELNGFPIDPLKWHGGYHPAVYNKVLPEGELDKVTAEVCRRLQETDVSKLTLEAQIWWRNHQKADKERLEREIAAKREESERREALSKLTPYERKLLGL